MKKLRVLLLVLVLCLLAGCSSAKEEDEEESREKKSKKKQEQVQDEDNDDDEDKDDDKDSDKDQPVAAPTAEELINSLADVSLKDEYLDADIKVVMEASMDLSSWGAPEGLGMSISLNADLNAVGSKEATHTSGSMKGKMSVTGMENLDSETLEQYEDALASMEEEIEQKYDEYKILDGDQYQVYSYDSDYDSWSTYYEYGNDNSNDISSIATNLPSDSLENLALKEEGSYYVVTGTMPYDKMSESMEGFDDLTMGLGSELEDCYCDVAVKFDKSSRELKELEFSMNNVSAMGVEFNRFTIAMVINQIGGSQKVTVPDSVISAAGEVGSGDYLYDRETAPLDIASTGKYDAKTFMSEFENLTGADSDEWYIYNSDYGHTSVENSVSDSTLGWHLNFEFTVYDVNNEEWNTAEANFEGISGDYYKVFLEDYYAEGNEVLGQDAGNAVLWYVDGGDYNTYYVFKDGNTILVVNGRIYNWDDDVDDYSVFADMVNALDEITAEMELAPQ